MICKVRFSAVRKFAEFVRNCLCLIPVRTHRHGGQDTSVSSSDSYAPVTAVQTPHPNALHITFPINCGSHGKLAGSPPHPDRSGLARVNACVRFSGRTGPGLREHDSVYTRRTGVTVYVRGVKSRFQSVLLGCAAG